MVYKESIIVWYSAFWDKQMKGFELLTFGDGIHSPSLIKVFKTDEAVPPKGAWDVDFLGIVSLYKRIVSR